MPHGGVTHGGEDERKSLVISMPSGRRWPILSRAPPIFCVPVFLDDLSARSGAQSSGAGGATDLRPESVGGDEGNALARLPPARRLPAQARRHDHDARDGAAGVNLDNRGRAKERFERPGRYPVFRGPGRYRRLVGAGARRTTIARMNAHTLRPRMKAFSVKPPMGLLATTTATRATRARPRARPAPAACRATGQNKRRA